MGIQVNIWERKKWKERNRKRQMPFCLVWHTKPIDFYQGDFYQGAAHVVRQTPKQCAPEPALGVACMLSAMTTHTSVAIVSNMKAVLLLDERREIVHGRRDELESLK